MIDILYIGLQRLAHGAEKIIDGPNLVLVRIVESLGQVALHHAVHIALQRLQRLDDTIEECLVDTTTQHKQHDDDKSS